MKVKLITNDKQITDEILELKSKMAELKQTTINENSSKLYQLYDEQLTRKLKEYIKY